MHGKFTRFMTGGKFTGAVTCGKIRPGNFVPGGGTSINFAVPSDATIKRERVKSSSCCRVTLSLGFSLGSLTNSQKK